MAIFSKYKVHLATSVGAAAIGGLSVYYGLGSLHGIPLSKWDNNWDKYVSILHSFDLIHTDIIRN